MSSWNENKKFLRDFSWVFVEQKQAACAYINFKKRPINYRVAQMGQKSNIKLSSFYTTLQQCFARRSFQLNLRLCVSALAGEWVGDLREEVNCVEERAAVKIATALGLS
jgi:hypothetical protein